MTQKSELELLAAIDLRMGELVGLANYIIDSAFPRVQTDLNSQLRNALAIANASPHPLVLTSFIGYQMGRAATSRAWKDTGLGDALMKAIEGDIREWAAVAAGPAEPPNVQIDVQMRMARLLLGFMSHRWVHKNSERKAANPKNVPPGRGRQQ
jgi:hypothetical protein